MTENPRFLSQRPSFGGRGGFSGAVHADDEDDERFSVRAGKGRRLVRGQTIREVSARGFHHILGGDITAEAAEFVDDLGGEADAEVRTDEIGFEVVPIDFSAI